jgi:hypothetical protein
MPHIKIEIKASRFTTRQPEDLDEMHYVEQIRHDIERVLRGRDFHKVEIKAWGEK